MDMEWQRPRRSDKGRGPERTWAGSPLSRHKEPMDSEKSTRMQRAMNCESLSETPEGAPYRRHLPHARLPEKGFTGGGVAP